MGFYLRKKETGRAGGRAVLCWAVILLCWARWAGLGADLALQGVGWAWGLALGWVGRGFVYGLHCTCLLHVFMVSLCLSSCVPQICIMGLEQTKPGMGE